MVRRPVNVPVPPSELRALVGGEIVVVFADEPLEGTLRLVPGDPLDPEELKPAYRRWRGISVAPVDARVVEGFEVSRLDPDAAMPRHLRTRIPDDGHLLVVRVSPDDPVLSDVAFAARHAAVRAALR